MPDLIKINGVLVPQYLADDGLSYEDLKGANGGAYTTVLGPDGTPASTTNRFPTDAQLTGSVVETVNAANAARVKLVGRRVTNSEVLARAVRAATANAEVDVPDGAIGGIFTVSVEGVTGTFAAGEGLNLQVKQRVLALSPTPWIAGETLTSKTTGIGSHTILRYPTIDPALTNFAAVSGRPFEAVQMPTYSRVQFNIVITGTFAAGEGFDCAGYVTWLY